MALKLFMRKGKIMEDKINKLLREIRERLRLYENYEKKTDLLEAMQTSDELNKRITKKYNEETDE